MKVNSTYGSLNSPELDEAVGNNTRCHYCNTDENEPVRFMKKGDPCIRFVFNSGPVGTAYVCMEHAEQISEELIKLLFVWNAMSELAKNSLSY
jgi:predicted DCC family thiol-disulfide oxidoreductase YuxK